MMKQALKNPLQTAVPVANLPASAFLILNRLYSRSCFTKFISSNDIHALDTVVERFLSNYPPKNNKSVLIDAYKILSKFHRNEYFYLNTLLNKLLLGKHSVKTATALTQIPIAKSKADFILINGKAVVYEIKTELDSFNRLKTQLNDYYKAFNSVCVVTSEKQFESAFKILGDGPVGIYVLTSKNQLSTSLRKEPEEYNDQLNHEVIFKLLRKYEFENILLDHFRFLPDSCQAFYYDACMDMFSQIPIYDAYNMALKELKRRNQLKIKNFEKVPYELKSLIYFLSPSESEWKKIEFFLNRKYGV